MGASAKQRKELLELQRKRDSTATSDAGVFFDTATNAAAAGVTGGGGAAVTKGLQAGATVVGGVRAATEKDAGSLAAGAGSAAVPSPPVAAAAGAAPNVIKAQNHHQAQRDLAARAPKLEKAESQKLVKACEVYRSELEQCQNKCSRPGLFNTEDDLQACISACAQKTKSKRPAFLDDLPEDGPAGHWEKGRKDGLFDGTYVLEDGTRLKFRCGVTDVTEHGVPVPSKFFGMDRLPKCSSIVSITDLNDRGGSLDRARVALAKCAGLTSPDYWALPKGTEIGFSPGGTQASLVRREVNDNVPSSELYHASLPSS